MHECWLAVLLPVVHSKRPRFAVRRYALEQHNWRSAYKADDM
jgi:hypothetical protein